jgi:hypothetical protein
MGDEVQDRAGGVHTPRWVLAAAAALVAVFAALSQVTAWGLPDDVDERAYVVVGRLNLEGHGWTGELAAHIGPVSLYLNQLGLIGVPTAEFAEEPTPRHYGRARTGLLPMGILAALLVFAWSRRLYGPAGGLLSLALFCLHPIAIGYAGLANVDMTHAATTTLTAYLLWRFLVRPGPGWLAAVGVAFGLALGTKFLAVLIAPVVLGAVAVRGAAAFGAEGRGATRRALGTLAGLALLGAALLVTLHAVYQLRGGFSPLDAEAYASERFARLASIPGLNALLALVPWPMVRGIDLLSAYDGADVPVYLRGVFGHDHWDYYLWCFLVKTPEPILAALVLGAAACAARLPRAERAERLAVVLAALCVALPLVALSTVIQRRVGIRYVLQLVPLLCVLGGALVPAARALLRTQAARIAAGAVAGAAALFTLAEAVGVAPNSIAYFNRSSGGQAEAWRTFLDSNADFGQYRERGLELLRERGHAPLEVLRGQEGPRFGRVAVYLTSLVVAPGQRGGGRSWVVGFEPIDHAGAAWWLFDVTPERYEALVARDDTPRRREEIAEAYWRAGHDEDARRHVDAIPAGEPSLLRDVLAFEVAADAGTADLRGAGIALAARALELGRASVAAELLGRPDWPASPERTRLLARSLEERRRLGDAIELVRGAPGLERDPLNVLLLSFLLRRAGRLDEALALLDDHAALLGGSAAAEELRADIEEARETRGFLVGP